MGWIHTVLFGCEWIGDSGLLCEVLEWSTTRKVLRKCSPFATDCHGTQKKSHNYVVIPYGTCLNYLRDWCFIILLFQTHQHSRTEKAPPQKTAHPNKRKQSGVQRSEAWQDLYISQTRQPSNKCMVQQKSASPQVAVKQRNSQQKWSTTPLISHLQRCPLIPSQGFNNHSHLSSGDSNNSNVCCYTSEEHRRSKVTSVASVTTSHRLNWGLHTSQSEAARRRQNLHR